MTDDSIEEIGNLLKQVTFEDKKEELAGLLCEIIVKGKPTNYTFKAWQDGSGYYATDKNEKCCDVSLDELTETLIVKMGLLEVEFFEEDYIPKVCLQPTPKAFEYYEKFKKEERLNNDGYLINRDGSLIGYP